MKFGTPIQYLLIASLSCASIAHAEEIFPDRIQAMKWMADRVVNQLFLYPNIPSEKVRIFIHGTSPEAGSAARLLSENLRTRGYDPVSRCSNRSASIEITLCFRLNGGNQEVLLQWERPHCTPLKVAYSTKPWLEPGFHSTDLLRISSDRFHPSRVSARNSALEIARSRILNMILEEAPSGALPIKQGETQIRTMLDHYLPVDKVNDHVKAVFYQRSEARSGPLFKIHVLIRFPSEAKRALVSSIVRDIRVSRYILLGKGGFLVVFFIFMIFLYGWADGKSRGFLRGPLRLAFCVILLSLVLGTLVC